VRCRVPCQASLFRSSMWSYERVLSLRLLALVSLLLSLVLPSASLGQVGESPAARIAREQLPAVVTLVALDESDQPLSLGSGFFITGSGVVATNAHVVEGASQVIVRWRSQRGTAIRILNFDQRHDLVTLQTSFTATPAVPLGDSELVTIGQDVVVLSSPYGLEGTVSTGILSGVRNIDGTKLLQITAPISPGSSGGPVFNPQGSVIGVASATFAKGQSLNFALPVNLLRNLPPSSVTFSKVKRIPLDSSKIQNVRELVYPDNVIEYIIGDSLYHLTVSLQNRTNDTIGHFQILTVVKNHKGEVLNYALTELKDTVIPPKLAKQVTLPASAERYTTWPEKPSLKGSCEIRILDFKIITRGGGTVEDLFKR
jgi:hypothetical protein